MDCWVGDAGVERGRLALIVCKASRNSNGAGAVRAGAVSSETEGVKPAVTRSVSLPKVGTGRYGASTYPFDPGNGGSLAPIRWDDGPGTVGEMTEENEGDHTTAAAGTAAAAATAAAASAGSSWI